ncbi:TonB-dependent receptor [Bacteroides sp.]|uniref:SusC/RagA family TonB-linked outer membrane protein n=1 Tax=Bacteroides sp. TaxID=29523 RepID=UPI0025C15AA1|nr:TonB-dependent receptor [Bacteroides sp.]
MSKQQKRLYAKVCLLLFFLNIPFVAFAVHTLPATVEVQQNRVIKGVVKDEKGELLIGVNVVVKDNPAIGTVTDVDGAFTLSVPQGTKALRVSYIGYKELDIRLGEKSSLNIILEEDALQLGEVQVIAYGTQKKVTVTGAISSIGSDELLKTPAASMGNALSGKMPGLSSVQYSGQPGGDDPTLLVRGIGTLGGGTAPLVLVDGVERAFFQMDPNEVEDITILKDASATAVFGVRGANGVILVTTKRGEKGNAKVSFSTSVGVQLPTRLLNFTNSYQYATYYNEAQMNDGVKPENVRFSPEIVQAFKDHSQPLLYPDMDWMDYLLNDAAFQSQHNVNVSGGTDRVKYFVSAGLFTQDGIFKTFDTGYDFNFKYKRYNYRANLDFEVTKTTDLSVNIGGRVEDRNRPISSSSDAELFRFIYRATPFSGAGIVDGKWIKSNPDYIPGTDNENSEDALNAYYGMGYTSKVNNVLNTDVTLKQSLDFITKGLSFKIKGAYNSAYYHTKKRSNKIPYYTPLLDENNNVVFRKSGPNSELGYEETRDADRNWYAEASLNYKRKFKKHNVSALLLYNQSKNYYPEQYPDIPTGYVGLVGRVTYDYATRYLVDFNIGYNGSENFAPGKRYGVFPAVSLGWIVSEEKFMKKNLPFISYLKLRGSYGVVGNDKIGNNRFLYLPDSYAFGGGGYFFGTNVNKNQPGVYEGRIGNKGVTWEKAYKQNYGIDIYFLDSRLKLNFDYFYDHREDILITRNNMPGFLGMTLPAVNYGVVDNKGFEVSVGWNDKIGDNFKYWVNANLSHAKNKIVEMDEVKRNEEYLYRTGLPVGQPFAYKFWGFYDETANERYKQQYGTDIAAHASVLQPGDCVYVDLNKDGAIDEDDQQPFGYTNNPQYTGGVTLGFSWKNFDFSMMWNYAWNTSRVLGETFRQPLGGTNTHAILLEHYENRWTPENAANAKYPRASFASVKSNYANSDIWIADASYIRLKNIEISYRFDFPFIKKIGINQLRLFANGYNLLTFDKLKISDPESLTGNRPEYPLMRVFNLGLKVGF